MTEFLADTSVLNSARAVAVQGALARRGHHRVALPDLLIAAAAEAVEVTVLHYDSDYDSIARETGQAVEWVVPRGSTDRRVLAPLSPSATSGYVDPSE